MASIGEAQEEGTYPIVLTYTLGGVAITPVSVIWTLSRTSDRSIINSREDVSISTLSSVNTITLTADDLAINNDADIDRKLTAKMVYDPGTLPQNGQAEFTIKPLDKVP